MKQTVVLHDGKVFLREGWYCYGNLIEILQAAGQLTAKQVNDYSQIILDVVEERKKNATK